jgi:hypothetical protein
LQESDFQKRKGEWEQKIQLDKKELESDFQTHKRALESDFQRRHREWKEKVESDKKALNVLVSQKTEGFPWLAEAWADYQHLLDVKTAGYLSRKSHPAVKAAEQVRQIASERRVAERLSRILRYQLEYYEKLFPWLVDFKGEDVDELIIMLSSKRQQMPLSDEPDDPAKKWLTEQEYAKLSTIDRNQLALDRYWQKRRSKWEIGRDYERYIGWFYESKGYSVYYQGIIEGFADLGRDLIAERGDTTLIIQCKNWSQEKIIHEKHIFQVFGTTIEYWLNKNRPPRAVAQPTLFPELLQKDKIVPVFVTSTKLSEKAREFANALGVQVSENVPLSKYPAVKCNVSRRTNEKIYHLPFDQQYDSTLVEEERNERYVGTVREAEELGFRRAFRWRGNEAEVEV